MLHSRVQQHSIMAGRRDAPKNFCTKDTNKVIDFVLNYSSDEENDSNNSLATFSVESEDSDNESTSCLLTLALKRKSPLQRNAL